MLAYFVACLTACDSAGSRKSTAVTTGGVNSALDFPLFRVLKRKYEQNVHKRMNETAMCKRDMEVNAIERNVKFQSTQT